MLTIKKRGLGLAAAVFSALIGTTGCTGGIVEEEPPESTYTQAEVYAPMEAEIAEIVQDLPDFPGFYSRTWSGLDCLHNGQADYDYINVEITYVFDEGTSLDPLVRQEYLDFLRSRWADQGYDVHRDEATPDGVNHSLEARRDDGINLWYRVAGLVGLTVQSGCVPVSDKSEIEYIQPAGGIEAGGPLDLVTTYFPDGIPTSEAVSPFAESESASSAGMVPWVREPDPIGMGANPFDDQL